MKKENMNKKEEKGERETGKKKKREQERNNIQEEREERTLMMISKDEIIQSNYLLFNDAFLNPMRVSFGQLMGIPTPGGLRFNNHRYIEVFAC